MRVTVENHISVVKVIVWNVPQVKSHPPEGEIEALWPCWKRIAVAADPAQRYARFPKGM
jgi:hypothetical protein